MYKQIQPNNGTMKGIKAYRAETIEKTLERMRNNKEPIQSTITAIYTDRKDGVQPDFDINTDKFEFLVEGKDAISKTKRAKRDNIVDLSKKLDKENKDIQGKDSSETK